MRHARCATHSVNASGTPRCCVPVSHAPGCLSSSPRCHPASAAWGSARAPKVIIPCSIQVIAGRAKHRNRTALHDYRKEGLCTRIQHTGYCLGKRLTMDEPLTPYIVARERQRVARRTPCLQTAQQLDEVLAVPCPQFMASGLQTIEQLQPVPLVPGLAEHAVRAADLQ